MFVSQIIDEAAEILATTDENKIFRKLTQAVQTLMESGHYFHSQAEVDVCTGWDGQTITLPRGIEVPLGVNIDGSPTYFRGRLFQYHVNKGGMYNPVDWAWDDRGFVSTIMDIRQPSQLVAVAEHEADAGKQIRIIGTDQWNRDLRSQTETGVGVDGLIIPIHAQKDFAYGTIQPDGVTIQSRKANVSPISKLLSNLAHQMVTGQSAVLKLKTGTLPNVLVNGNTYYIGVVNDNTIVLYQNLLDAKSGTNPITLDSIIGSGTVTLKDERDVSLLTTVNLVPDSGGIPITIDSPNEVTFSIGGASATATILSGAVNSVTLTSGGNQYATTPIVSFVGGGGSGATATCTTLNGVVTAINLVSGGTGYTSVPFVSFSTATGSLPSPLQANLTYFAKPADDTNLSLFGSIQDAQNNANQIFLTGNSGKFNVDVRKPIAPQTTLEFSVFHYYSQGDVVQAFTSGGTLPSPLIAGQNYFVNVVDAQTITLHTSKADALASTNLIFVNPIILTDSGTGTNSIVKLIPATAKTGKTQQITAPGLTFNTPTPITTASATAVVVGSVSTVTMNNNGKGYAAGVIPTVTFSDPPAVTDQVTRTATGYAVMQLDAVGSSTYAVGGIVITDVGQGYRLGQPPTIQFSGGTPTIVPTATAVIKTSNVSLITLTNAGLGYQQPPKVKVVGGGGTGATASAEVDTRIVNVVSIDRTGSVATVACETSHLYVTGNTVVISGASPAGYNGSVSITRIDDLRFSYIVSPDLPIQATGVITVTTGKLTAINVITQGTGYTSQPTITIEPSSGVFVEFTSTGELPAPLVAGTAYLAENSSAGGVFTVTNADFSDLNITSTATGNLFVALSRTFSIGFNTLWSGDFSGVSTGQEIYLATDYILPLGVSSGIKYYIRKKNTDTVQIFDSASNANGSGTTGIINVVGLGTGQSYYAVRFPAYAQAFNNQLYVPNTEFLYSGEQVSFETTGTLPYPLVPYNETSGDGLYSMSVNGNSITLTDRFNNPVVFANNGIPTLGIGKLSLVISDDFSFVPSTTIVSEGYTFETGDQITVRANIGDTLPVGLYPNAIGDEHYYYVRRFDNSSYELYDTRQNALNIGSTTGRIAYVNTGDSIDSFFFADAIMEPTLVKAVQHVEKPLTVGYVSLYAYDYGRSNDMALIGQYHPSETNPKYRRIRIGKQCSWARIIYRVKSPEISSAYDYIPVENQRAIIAAVHAVDLEDKDFIEQSQKYWATAFQYLKNQSDSMDGHAMQPPQINNITYGDGTDEVMF